MQAIMDIENFVEQRDSEILDEILEGTAIEPAYNPIMSFPD
jgi:hypothetical protein